MVLLARDCFLMVDWPHACDMHVHTDRSSLVCRFSFSWGLEGHYHTVQLFIYVLHSLAFVVVVRLRACGLASSLWVSLHTVSSIYRASE